MIFSHEILERSKKHWFSVTETLLNDIDAQVNTLVQPAYRIYLVYSRNTFEYYSPLNHNELYFSNFDLWRRGGCKK